jgi:hypothetical protein
MRAIAASKIGTSGPSPRRRANDEISDTADCRCRRPASWEISDMATNLVSSVMQFLTPDLVAKIARTLGIDPDVAQKAVNAAVPAILASFAGLAAKPAGAQQLSDALEQQPPGMLSQLTSAIGGTDQKAIADAGSGLLSTLLGGGGLNGLVSAMSAFSGINQNASKSVLGLIAPMVVGTLGQQQRSGGLDARGLANLLSSQKDQIAAAMPSGLANMMGARGMLDAFDGSLRRGADTAAGRMAGTMSETAMGASQSAYRAARNPLTASWPLWILALVVLAGLGWYFLGNHEQQLAEQTKGLINRAEDLATGTPNAADVSTDLTSSVASVRTTLQGMTDVASARAALPKLQQATEQLDKINSLAAQLPPNSRKELASVVEASMPALNRLCDQALSNPQIAGLAKPAIDALRARLQLLAQA